MASTQELASITEPLNHRAIVHCLDCATCAPPSCSSSSHRRLLLFIARFQHDHISHPGDCLRGNNRQQWVHICFNDVATKFSAGSHRRPGGHMYMVGDVPHRPTSYILIELDASTYFSNLGMRWTSCPSAFYSIMVCNSRIFVLFQRRALLGPHNRQPTDACARLSTARSNLLLLLRTTISVPCFGWIEERPPRHDHRLRCRKPS